MEKVKKTRRPRKKVPKLGSKFTKRKRGMLKKSMELSKDYEKNVFFVVYDPEMPHMLVYQSAKFQKGIQAVKKVAMQ